MKARGRVIWAICVLVVLSACSSPYRSQVVDIPSHSWSEPVTIVWENVDTTHLFDWQFFMRCSDRKISRPFAVRIEWLTPDSLCYQEVLQVPLKDSSVTAPLMRRIRVDYRRRVRLSRMGNYRIVLTPEQPICGVEAVGLQSLGSVEN